MSIDLFRSGDARVIVSGKALIEGFDAPAADIGINVASSGSRTKAIQSIGRVLRKNSKDGDKLGLIIRFYISNTIDALTYKKCDFSQITGARRNRYFLWDPEDADMGMEDQEQSAPPYSPLPKEEALDWENVRPGDRLFFEADGEDYQLDPAGNVYKKSESRQKKYIVNAQNVTQILAPFMEDMRNNYFRQSSTGRIFLRQYDRASEGISS